MSDLELDGLRSEIRNLVAKNEQLKIDKEQLNKGIHRQYKELLGLEEENKQLREDIEAYRDIHAKQLSIDHKRYEKLEAIQSIIKIPDVWTHPDPIKAIREVLELSINSDRKTQKDEEDVE